MGYRGPVNFMGEDKELRQPKRCSLTSFGKKLKGGGNERCKKERKRMGGKLGENCGQAALSLRSND